MEKETHPFRDVGAAVVAHFGTHLAAAKALGYDDLRNVYPWTSGLRPFPPEHCVTLERESGGALSRKMLRPGDWQAIWPELIELVDQFRSTVKTGPVTQGATHADAT